jgi:hypothetical protein
MAPQLVDDPKMPLGTTMAAGIVVPVLNWD